MSKLKYAYVEVVKGPYIGRVGTATSAAWIGNPFFFSSITEQFWILGKFGLVFNKTHFIIVWNNSNLRIPHPFIDGMISTRFHCLDWLWKSPLDILRKRVFIKCGEVCRFVKVWRWQLRAIEESEGYQRLYSNNNHGPNQ